MSFIDIIINQNTDKHKLKELKKLINELCITREKTMDNFIKEAHIILKCKTLIDEVLR